jgi:hypothetical protein
MVTISYLGMALDKPGVFQHGQRMSKVVGLAADMIGDRAPRGVSFRDRGQYGMVKRRIAEVWLLGKQSTPVPPRTGGSEPRRLRCRVRDARRLWAAGDV